MAAKSIVDIALANIDADIAALQRAKDIILAVSGANAPAIGDEAPKKKRGRKKKGLPTEEPSRRERELADLQERASKP